MKIHPSATIDPSARLGQDVEIGPGAVVGSNVEVGDGCRIGPHAVLHSHVMLGAASRVHAGAVLGDTPQDLAFKSVVSHVRIGRRCVIREGVTVHRGTHEGTETVVGDDCFLMANSHVAHNCLVGNRVILANGVLLGGYVEIGDGAFLSGNVVVHQFCRIGRLAMAGGLSAITKDLPPFCTARTGGLNMVSGLNTVGLKRNGFTPAERSQVRQCFDVLYRSGLNVSQARDRLADLGNPYGLEWAAFIEGSRRGLCRMACDGDRGDLQAGS